MKNLGNLKSTILVLAVLAGVGSYFWLASPPSVYRQTGIHQQSKSTLRVDSTNGSPLKSSHPKYGKASLSEEEKRILSEPFAKVTPSLFDGPRNAPNAYRKGMICLKHRLNYWEVNELVGGNNATLSNLPLQGVGINYEFGFGQLLEFDFDERGGLRSVQPLGSGYRLPSPEDVRPDTPIEPPPKSDNRSRSIDSIPHYPDYGKD